MAAASLQVVHVETRGWWWAPDAWSLGALGARVFLHVANLLSPPSCSARPVAQQTRGVLDARVLPSSERLDSMASAASALPLPGLSNHDHFLASITTLEPLGPLKVDKVFNGSDDDAFLSFMDPFVSLPAWESPPSCARHAAPVVDHSPRTKAGNARRRRRREPAKRGDASTFEKRITSNTYLRRLYMTHQQAIALAPTMACVAELHEHTKDHATTVSARVAVLDEHDVAHELECKCYLSSREHHFVLCAGWSTLSKQSRVVLGDAVVFSRVGQGHFRVVRVERGV